MEPDFLDTVRRLEAVAGECVKIATECRMMLAKYHAELLHFEDLHGDVEKRVSSIERKIRSGQHS